MDKKLKISPHTLKHYEKKQDKYFFYNVKDDVFLDTDKTTGLIISTLDGTLSGEDIVCLLHKNSPEIPLNELREHFQKTLEFLIKEGYIYEYNG